jgi:hypothetical protein
VNEPFQSLRERLLRGGVAPRYVRRYVNELTDHLEDLTVEEEQTQPNRSMAKTAALLRLGQNEELEKAMMEQRNLQSWSKRAPWMVFGLGPVLSLVGAFSLTYLALILVGRYFVDGTHVNEATVFFVGFGIVGWFYVLCPLIVGWGIAALAIRHRMGIKWPAIGMAFAAILGGTAFLKWDASSFRGVGPIHMYFLLHTSYFDDLGCIGCEKLHGMNLVMQSIRANYGIVRALVLFALIVLPWIAWHFVQQRRSHPAVG